MTGVSDATQISAGGIHSYALRSGGAISCWGWNNFGQRGNGTISHGSNRPVSVIGFPTEPPPPPPAATPAASTAAASSTTAARGSEHRGDRRLDKRWRGIVCRRYLSEESMRQILYTDTDRDDSPSRISEEVDELPAAA